MVNLMKTVGTNSFSQKSSTTSQVQKQLSQQLNQNDTTQETQKQVLQTFAEDYCNNLESTVSSKLQIVNRLRTIDPNDAQFTDACLDSLNKSENKWFDPIIPSDIITYGDMCQGFRDLYSQLNQRGLNSSLDLGTYAYVLVYHMYLNSMEERIFEKCVDSKLQEDPLKYCTRSIVSNLNLTLWSQGSKDKACSEGAVKMQEKCNNTQSVSGTGDGVKTDGCYPCAFTISYVFAKYEKFLTTSIEGVFQQLSQRASEALILSKQDSQEDEETQKKKKAAKTLKLQLPE
eukprot:403333557